MKVGEYWVRGEAQDEVKERVGGQTLAGPVVPCKDFGFYLE